mgnify:CR=1 FL=1
MEVIVCLDDKNAMSFNNRRQSTDRVVRDRILALANGRKLWMSPYSAGQFSQDLPICADEDFAAKVGRADVCFVEDAAMLSKLKDIQRIIVLRWNRVYPADTYFPIQDFANRWTLVEKEEFAGYSHKTITQEVYAL